MSRVTSAQWPMKRALEGAIVLYALRISRGVPSMEPAALKESLSSGLYFAQISSRPGASHGTFASSLELGSRSYDRSYDRLRAASCSSTAAGTEKVPVQRPPEKPPAATISCARPNRSPAHAPLIRTAGGRPSRGGSASKRTTLPLSVARETAPGPCGGSRTVSSAAAPCSPTTRESESAPSAEREAAPAAAPSTSGATSDAPSNGSSSRARAVVGGTVRARASPARSSCRAHPPAGSERSELPIWRSSSSPGTPEEGCGGEQPSDASSAKERLSGVAVGLKAKIAPVQLPSCRSRLTPSRLPAAGRLVEGSTRVEATKSRLRSAHSSHWRKKATSSAGKAANSPSSRAGSMLSTKLAPPVPTADRRE
mmetsp:Transcript_20092/g.65774  ORF Transcript_20092/g.65774 Transcript_20092/m.65774 type:complete len:368 (+) Transcript_20092:1152-2255(+)